MIYHPTRHDNFLWYLILRGHFSNGRNKKKHSWKRRNLVLIMQRCEMPQIEKTDVA